MTTNKKDEMEPENDSNGGRRPSLATAHCSESDQLREAKEHLRYLLSVAPHPSCELFHHAKRDRHAFDEPCPVVARYRARLKQVEHFLSPNVEARNGERQ